jgi:hypothetical protein
MADWPTEALSRVVPRLPWIVAAHLSHLSSAVSPLVLREIELGEEATFRSGESGAKMHLVDWFAAPRHFKEREAPLLPPPQLLFRQRGGDGYTRPETIDQFKAAFSVFSGGLLDSLDWNGVIVAGGES